MSNSLEYFMGQALAGILSHIHPTIVDMTKIYLAYDYAQACLGVIEEKRRELINQGMPVTQANVGIKINQNESI